MPDRVSELEAKVSTLREQVASLAERLSVLEAGSSQAARGPAARKEVLRAAAALPAGDQPTAAVPGAGLLGAALPLGGRTLLVCAGAFVLRALTDSGTTPGWLGVTLGLAYALVFILFADRAARADASVSATVHGASALLIAFPLLYESVTRFRLVSPAVAMGATALVASALLLVAFRRRLEALAWLAAAGSVATAFALMFGSDRMAPATLFLVVLGVECLWLGYVLEWRGLRWPVAALADLCALGLAIRAVSPYAQEGPRAAMLVGAMLLALYLVSFAVRTILLHRSVVAFEVVQTGAAIGAGLGGAAIIATHTTTSAAGFGVVAAACGATAYAVALAFRERRPQDRANFPFYTAVAVLLMMSGTALALRRPAVALTWCGLGIASTALMRRLGRRSLAAHAAIYAWGGAIAAGLTSLSTEALFVAVTRSWAPWNAMAVVVLGTAAACVWLGARAGPEAGATWVSRLPQLALVLLVALGAVGLAAAALVPLFAGMPGAGGSPGTAGAVRTAVLVVAAVLLARAGRGERWREAGWLASAMLAVTGFKIVLEDLPLGRPATLVFTFGLYGAALLLVPRLLRRTSATKGDPPVSRGASHARR